MGNSIISLDKVPIGEKCTVCSLIAKGNDRRRLLDLGIVAGTEIEVLAKSPAGDPVSYLIRGAVIAFRCEDAGKIIVRF